MQEESLTNTTKHPPNPFNLNPLKKKIGLYLFFIALIFALLIFSTVVIFAFPFMPILTPIAITIGAITLVIAMLILLDLPLLMKNLFKSSSKIDPTTDENAVTQSPTPNRTHSTEIIQSSTIYTLDYCQDARNLIFLEYLSSHTPPYYLRSVNHAYRNAVDCLILTYPKEFLSPILRSKSQSMGQQLAALAKIQKNPILMQGSHVHGVSPNHLVLWEQSISLAGADCLNTNNDTLTPSTSKKPHDYVLTELAILDFLNEYEKIAKELGDCRVIEPKYLIVEMFYPCYGPVHIESETHDFLEHSVLYQLNSLPSAPCLQQDMAFRFSFDPDGKNLIVNIYHKTATLELNKALVEAWEQNLKDNASGYLYDDKNANATTTNQSSESLSLIISLSIPSYMALKFFLVNPVYIAMLMISRSRNNQETSQFLGEELEKFRGFTAGIPDEHLIFLINQLKNKEQKVRSRAMVTYCDVADNIMHQLITLMPAIKDFRTISYSFGKTKIFTKIFTNTEEYFENFIDNRFSTEFLKIFAYYSGYNYYYAPKFLVCYYLVFITDHFRGNFTPQLVNFVKEALFHQVERLTNIPSKIALLREMLKHECFQPRLPAKSALERFTFFGNLPTEKTVEHEIREKINVLEKEQWTPSLPKANR